MKLKVVNLTIDLKMVIKLFLMLFLIFLFTSGMLVIAATETVTGGNPPLEEEIDATLDWTTVTNDVDVDDYTMSTSISGTNIHMPVPDSYIYANEGESALDVGTSYITLEESTVLGDYGSIGKNGIELMDQAFLERTYGSATESNASYTTFTDPGLSSSSSDVYISAQMALTDVTGTETKNVLWDADVWNDVDEDGVDDSATVTEEEYIPLTKNVYILVVGKIDSSDTDASTTMRIWLRFYTGGTDYDVTIDFNGGSDAASTSTHTWSYTGANSAALSIHEAEDEYVAVLIDLADLIADDTDSSPNISGLNTVRMQLLAGGLYGDGSTDTVTGYIHNIAIFDSPPALTDDDVGSGNSVDYNGGTTNTVLGDATNYDKHDILLPYVSAASNNDFDTRVYFEKDVLDSDVILTRFHMLSINGKMRIPPNRDFEDASEDLIEAVVVKTEIGSDKQRRDVTLYWDFDYKRKSDNSDFVTGGYVPSLTGHVLVQVLDDDDNYASINSMDDSLISAELGTTDKTDEFESTWGSWSASSTEITTDLWSVDPSDGDTVEVHYAYYTRESGNEANVNQNDGGVFAFLPSGTEEWFSSLWDNWVFRYAMYIGLTWLAVELYRKMKKM